MPRFDVAHIREQGQDLIIIPLDDNFKNKPSAQQEAAWSEFQVRASAAGLKGTVALVWDGGFLAPRPWHPYFRSLSLLDVMASVNRELSW